MENEIFTEAVALMKKTDLAHALAVTGLFGTIRCEGDCRHPACGALPSGGTNEGAGQIFSLPLYLNHRRVFQISLFQH